MTIATSARWQIGSDLSDLAVSACEPPQPKCSSHIPYKLKALICHPGQSEFNASNYSGSASRQIGAWRLGRLGLGGLAGEVATHQGLLTE